MFCGKVEMNDGGRAKNHQNFLRSINDFGCDMPIEKLKEECTVPAVIVRTNSRNIGSIFLS